MPFNPTTDKIALTLREFTLKKKSEVFWQEYAEPYVVTLAVDSKGPDDTHAFFNAVPFPKVRAGDTIKMHGTGRLIYGPKNPGDFLSYYMLWMESDNDVRRVGEIVQEIVEDKKVTSTLKILTAGNPTASVASSVLQTAISIVAGQLKKNKDDQLMLSAGSLLRDQYSHPYSIESTFITQNDYIRSEVEVIGLAGSRTRSMTRGFTPSEDISSIEEELTAFSTLREIQL